MTVSYWQRRHVRRVECDYVVVGAGIAGSYAAMCLAQTGADVVLTDMREPAAGASGRNAGFLLAGTVEYYSDAIDKFGHETAREMWQLSLETRDLAFELAEQFGVAARRCGSLLLAVDDDEAATVERSARAMRADGFSAEFRWQDPLDRGFVASLHKPDDGVVDPAALVRAIVDNSGATTVWNNEVWTILPASNGVLVRGSHCDIVAQGALLALNAYTPLLVPALDGLIQPTRAQMLVTAPLDARILDVAGYANWGYEYFRQQPDGRFLMGGGRRRFRAQEVSWEDRTTENVQGALGAFLSHHFPEVAAAPVEQRWAGTMGFTTDGLPLIGRVPETPQAVFVAGFNGHGMGLALKTVERAVDVLLRDSSAGILDWSRLR